MKLFWFSFRFVRVGVGFLLGLPLDAGFPHSDEPEKAMMEELWVGVTLSGRSPMKRIPMKRDPEDYEAKGGGLDINNGSLKLVKTWFEFYFN